ncbi:MAG: peptidylprolyl isomerase [Acidobacteria bacterium]|nr:peptidylprolyl isomerase [Acidobacteriota bacterium]
MLARIVLPLAALGCAAAADVAVLEQIIAKVNGDIITRGELERTRQSLQAEMRQQNVPAGKMEEMLKEREKDFLKDQIDQLLLVQKGKELTINCDPEVNKEIGQIQLQAKLSDTDKFHQYVREQTGMTFEDFKQQLKNQCLTQRVIRQEVGGRISIAKPEIEKYYQEHKAEFIRKEQVFLREIFLSTAGKTPEQAAAVEKKARDLVARARKGEKFPEMARDHSEAESAKSFGEMGWWKRGELKKEIEDIVFKEKRNFVTDPLKVENGFLILKLEERHEAGQAPLEEVESEIQEKLYVPRMQPKVREYLTKLREDAFLEIREGYVDSGAAPGKDTGWRDPAQLKPETTTKAEVAARKKRRLLKVLPLPGGRKGREAVAAAAAATAPAPTTAPAAPAPAPK